MSIDSLVVCNSRQAKNFIIRAIRAGNVPYLTSSPGMGKSALIHEVAEEFGLFVIDHRLSTSAPEDLSGLPRFREDGKAEFTPFADLFPLEDTPIPKGYNGWLLLLDEFPSARKEVIAAAYKLVLDRMTGQKRLHPNVAIVLAGNKATDRAIVNPIGTAMQSRVVHFEMEFNFDVFAEDVMTRFKWDSRVIAFLHANQTKAMDFDPAHKNKTFCCPRTWDFINKDLHNMAPGALPDEDALYYSGHITPGVATEFVQFTKVYDRLASYEKVLANPDYLALPDDNNLMWATIMYLANQVTVDDFHKVIKYVERMSMVHCILFVRAVKHIEGITGVPEYRQSAAKLSRYLHG